MVLNRKERDKLLRQADILKAAESVFAVKGYHQATIQDIAKEAQYAVGTIYLYFKDKETLYLHLIEGKIADLISKVKKEVEAAEGAKNKIKVLIREQLSYFEENQDFFRIYFSESGQVRWTIKDKIPRTAVDKFVEYVDYIAKLIKEGQKENLIRAELDPKRLAHMVASMMNALIIIPWLKGANSKEKATDIADFILDVFLNGVKSRCKRF